MNQDIIEIISNLKQFKNLCNSVNKIAKITISDKEVAQFVFIYCLALPVIKEIHRNFKKDLKEKYQLESILMLIEEEIVQIFDGDINNLIKKISIKMLKKQNEVIAELKQIDSLDDNEIKKYLKKVNLFDGYYQELVNVFLKKDKQKLGVVFTPPEVVAPMLRLLSDALTKHFGDSLENSSIFNIIDPFFGSGAFLLELLSSENLTVESFKTLYENRLEAKERVVFTHYLALLNITHLCQIKTGDIIIPNWLSLTDTFAEYDNRDKIIDIGRIDFF